MTYDGTLVMPQNAVFMDEEEMTYLNAGSAATFAKNMKGIWDKTRTFRWAWRDCGIKASTIAAAASYTYWGAVAKFGSAVVTVAAIASRVLAVIAGVGTVAAIGILWNKRVFY